LELQEVNYAGAGARTRYQSGNSHRRVPWRTKMKNTGRCDADRGEEREGLMIAQCFKLFYGPAAEGCPSVVDRRGDAWSAPKLRTNAAYDGIL